jgi:rSAM/selenodomain-associated transferase 1
MSGLDPADIAVAVIAKQPVAGRCKTRLTPPLEPREAAALAEAALADTLGAVAACRARRRVIALDGTAGSWLPGGFEVVGQGTGGLDRRLANAFDAIGGPALLIGMDTPQLSPAAIDAALTALAAPRTDAVLGRALDGGYWAIGLRHPDPAVFEGVPMSEPGTAVAQRERLDRLGLRVRELERVRDFDTIADARAVARLCPESRFARTFAGLAWASAA